jgi:hypothetical protein
VRIPYYIQLDSINDLARLAAALEVVPSPIYSFKLKVKEQESNILAVGLNLNMGRPVFCYVDAQCNGEFIAYRAFMGNEEVNMVNAANNPAYSYAPVIRVVSIPKRLKGSKSIGYESIILNDLISLVKLGLYKYMRDEVLIPLFLSVDKGNDKGNGNVILGTFIGGNDDHPYFCYTILHSIPKENFVRYSSQSDEAPTFTNNIDEHGYIYMKIVRLKSTIRV